MARFGLTIIKSFTYRGNAEEYSNHYVLRGTAPADSAAWATVATAVIAEEKKVYPSTCSVVRVYGYADDQEDTAASYSLDYTISPSAPVPGTLSQTGTVPAPGDAAAWVRWRTSRTNSKGKPIYLRKYFHPVLLDAAGGDGVKAAQKTALLAFGAKLSDGTLSGGYTVTAAGSDDTITSVGASTYATTRTLRRRGKRPPA